MSILFNSQKILNMCVLKLVTRELTPIELLAFKLSEELEKANLGQADSITMYKKLGETDEGGVLARNCTVLVATRGDSLKIDAGLTGQIFFEPIDLDVESHSREGREDE